VTTDDDEGMGEDGDVGRGVRRKWWRNWIRGRARPCVCPPPARLSSATVRRKGTSVRRAGGQDSGRKPGPWCCVHGFRASATLGDVFFRVRGRSPEARPVHGIVGNGNCHFACT